MRYVVSPVETSRKPKQQAILTLLLQLEKINENKSLSEIFWRHASAQYRKLDYWRDKMDLKKRDHDYDDMDAGYCMADNEYEVFEKIDW
jgi:hypothetical protein